MVCRCNVTSILSTHLLGSIEYLYLPVIMLNNIPMSIIFNSTHYPMSFMHYNDYMSYYTGMYIHIMLNHNDDLVKA